MEKEVKTSPSVEAQAAEYTAPRIDTVLSPEQLEREVFYAGSPIPSGAPT